MEHPDNNLEQNAARPFNAGLSWQLAALVLLALAGLFLLSKENYLLYHGIVEMLSVVVAVTIFSIGWNSKQFAQDNTLLVISVAYLSVGVFDFLHVFSYKGMGAFPDRGANLATQLWVTARYLQSGALVWAALLLGGKKRLNPNWLLIGWVLAGALLIVFIVPLRLFPTCYDESAGLTTFKIASEYVISGLLAVAGLLFWHSRHFLNRQILILLIASVALNILAELSFTLYVDVYGLFNFIGHIFKLISVVLVYLALVQGSLQSPYESLFRRLSLELAQRKTSEDKLHTANRELDAFVYTVSHDLRTPLTPIIGYADYLVEREEGLDDEARQLLAKISTLGRGMSKTMEDLLVLAKLGKLEVSGHPVSVEVVIDKVLMALGSCLHEAGQTVHKGALPESRVPESLLSQMFGNLIGNALQYGRGAAIEVGGERVEKRVRFYVRDHGPGVPANERERIFELFFRGSGAAHTKGTGIGLAIVRKIARLYHGQAWIEATPGGGTTFWVEMEEPEGD